MSKINQTNNFQDSQNEIGQNYTNSNIGIQHNYYPFKINKNYVIALLTILFLISLFFNYEFYKDKKDLVYKNMALEYKIKALPILIEKEKIMNQVFDREKAMKEIEELVK